MNYSNATYGYFLRHSTCIIFLSPTPSWQKIHNLFFHFLKFDRKNEGEKNSLKRVQLWPEEKVKEILFITYVIFSQLNVSPAYNLKSFLFRGFGAVNQIFNIYERIRNWIGWDQMRAKNGRLPKWITSFLLTLFEVLIARCMIPKYTQFLLPYSIFSGKEELWECVFMILKGACVSVCSICAVGIPCVVRWMQ